jgi:hypothetical protein
MIHVTVPMFAINFFVTVCTSRVEVLPDAFPFLLIQGTPIQRLNRTMHSVLSTRQAHLRLLLLEDQFPPMLLETLQQN